jgi:hypothetical protein
MAHKLIKTENYLLIIDDSVHPYDSSKVGNPIAHLPLNGSPILEGVDLLPPYSRHQEDGLENMVDEITSHWHGSSEEMIKGWFKFGYEKARDKYKYTEDDVKEFLETFTDHAPLSYMKSELEKGLHKRIGTQYPTEFECEMEYDCCKRYVNCIGCDATEDMINLRPKTIITAQGVQWVGKYK